MPNVLLGNEIIIISVEDARKLGKAFPVSRDNTELLQRLGVLGILEDLRSAVRRYDYSSHHEAEVENVIGMTKDARVRLRRRAAEVNSA